MKAFLFLSLSLLFFVKFSTQSSCPLYKLSEGAKFFSDSPKPNPAGSSCPFKESCCTSTYNTRIQQHTDLLQPLYSADFMNKAACSALLSSLSCAACSPDSTKYFSVRRNNTAFRVCRQFCNSLRDACAPSGVSETDFCFSTLEKLSEGMFGGFAINIVDESSSCFSTTGECTADDYEVQASACVDGSRSLFYYWAENTTCVGPLPKVAPIGCTVSCDVGYFLSSTVGDISCQPCSAGHYSLGGGVKVDNWKAWSSELQIDTYCTSDKKKPRVKIPKDTCLGWVFGGNGEYVSSGNTSDSSSNVMEIMVKLVRPGFVSFVFRVDAEPYFDGLSFLVDGQPLMLLTSNVLDFKEQKYNLTQGFHTLTWRYSKDFSESEGEDRAAIKSIHVTGTQFADYECSACPPGTYSENGGSGICEPCPVNTYTDHSGTKSCHTCDGNTYSYRGSTSCSPRKACAQVDYEVIPSGCEQNLQRTVTYKWTSPVCDPNSFALPSQKSIPCVCPPGYMFIDGQCTGCPDGKILSDDGSNCVNCPAGTVALKTVQMSEFYEWKYGMTTNCTGDCGSTGWRLLGDSMDSGVQHGPSVSSTLVIPVKMVQDGNITLNFSLMCEKCNIRIVVDNRSSRGFYTPFEVKPSVPFRTVIAIPEGDQVVRISFSKEDPHGTNRNDRAVIHSLEIFGSTKGGALKCATCPAGFYSNTGASVCSKCAPGQSSPGGGTACTSCPKDTFNPVAGGICKPCGHGVKSSEGSLQCDNSCSYTSSSGKQFDFSFLKKNDGMYGPLKDSYGYFFFYLNLCQPPKTNNPCIDDEGKNVSSIACVKYDDFEPRGYDLGRVINFYDTNEGVDLVYNQGDDCFYDQMVQRNMTIHFICDNTAGVGLPTLTTVNVFSCATEFQWKSLYACPICSKQDYYFTLTDCVAGRRQKVYFWRENPKRCHSGTDLPAPQSIECVVSTIPCGPGQYLDEANEKCKLTEPGYYSVGGGVSYNEWINLPPPFTTDWALRGSHISSRTYDSSMTLDAQLATAGEISFVYRVWSYPTANFTFKVDDRIMLKSLDYSTSISQDGFTWQGARFPVEKGIHSFKWTYNSIREPGFVAVRNVTVFGTSYASSFQTLCPSGTISSTRGATSCQACPMNTFPASNRASCSNCSVGYYSFPMSTECTKQELCTADDWIPLRTVCDKDWKAKIYYVKSEPDICTGGAGPIEPEDVDCNNLKCAPGFFRQKAEGAPCVPCQSGSYYDPQKGCSEASQSSGGVAIKVMTYFTSESQTDSWPDSWSTSCVSEYDNGLCITGGWRMKGSYIDSGFHAKREADVTVSLKITLEVHGSISYRASIQGDKQNTGYALFIDGKAHDLPNDGSQLVTVPLKAGTRLITWNYFQRAGSSAIMTLQNVTIMGAANGGADRLTVCPRGYYAANPPISCEPCPAGTYNPYDGQTTCKTCENNTFSSSDGSTRCIPCGNGTFTSGEKSTSCLTTCVFVDPSKNIRYDLTPLRSKSIEFQDSLFKFSVSMCDPVSARPELASKCVDTDSGKVVEGYVCGQMLDADRGLPYFSGGRVLDFEPSNNRNVSAFHLLYSMGSAPDCSEFVVRLTFRCDATLTPAEDPKITKVRAISDCGSEAVINTRSACGFCIDEDYHALREACVDGKRNVSYIKSNDCLGNRVKNSTIQNCSVDDDDGTHIPLIVLLVVLGVVLILLILNGIFWWRNRQLKYEYSKLTSNTEKNEDLLNR